MSAQVTQDLGEVAAAAFDANAVLGGGGEPSVHPSSVLTQNAGVE